MAAAVILYDRSKDDREAIGRRIARNALTVVPPTDHLDVIAGQGTAARELFEEVGPLDFLFVPCGGGGLLSGSGIAARALSCLPRRRRRTGGGRRCDRSFRTGNCRRSTIRRRSPTAPDAIARLADLSAGPRQCASDMTTVDDATLLRTMFLLWERLKLVVEPTGALERRRGDGRPVSDRRRESGRDPDRRKRRFCRGGDAGSNASARPPE